MAETTKPGKSNTDELLTLLDYAHDRLVGRLEGMSVDEYLWEPVEGCWSVRAGEDGVFRAEKPVREPQPAPFTTIAWRMWHIGSDCLRGYCEAFWEHTGDGVALEWPGTPEAGLAEMNAQWARFRAHVAAMDEAALAGLLGPAAGPYAEDSYHALVLHALDEVIHHGAEIGTIRDLYLSGKGGTAWKS